MLLVGVVLVDTPWRATSAWIGTYGLSILVVFLCLAALYESWSIPVAVLLVIPLGLVGAIFAVTLRGLENDVYLQIGLLTTMGLASKMTRAEPVRLRLAIFLMNAGTSMCVGHARVQGAS